MATGGLVGSAAGPAARARLDELRASASILGAARVVHLGYADSGHGPVLYPDPPGRVRFARANIGQAAARLASLIREEHADLRSRTAWTCAASRRRSRRRWRLMSPPAGARQDGAVGQSDARAARARLP